MGNIPDLVFEVTVALFALTRGIHLMSTLVAVTQCQGV